nr:hypothetical protein [Altericroceibacterium endophyticum]
MPAGQSPEEAMDRLEPLFHERGTNYQRNRNRLTFDKKGQPAQDRMSVYDRGELYIEQAASGNQLRYNMVSRAFLFCFLAPLFFLAFAQMNILIGEYQASHEVSQDSEKPDEADETIDLPQNAIDKFLGAPAPEIEAPTDDEEGEGNSGPSPTPAYVFAGIFCVLYAVGRILEAKLVKRLFKRRLAGLDTSPARTSQTPTAPSSAG